MRGDATSRLRGLELFRDIDPRLIDQLGGESRMLHVSSGEDLVHSGDRTTELYVILVGEFQAIAGSADRSSTVVATLGPGSVDGEIAVMSGGRRSATQRATRPSEGRRDRSAGLRARLLDLAPELGIRLAADAVARLRVSQLARQLHALFPDPGAAALGDLLDRGELVTLHAGTVLFRHGNAADAAYLVVSGRLRVLVEDPAGAIRPIAEIGPGELVGELALLDDIPRTATVVAARDTELARMARPVYEPLALRQPAATLSITRVIVAQP